MDVETLARLFVDAYNSGELETRIELLFDPDVEFGTLRSAVEDTVYRGHDGIRQFVRDNEELWSDGHMELHELEVRDEQVVVTGHIRLKGRASGAWTELTTASAGTVRNGRIGRLMFHQTAEDARRELGWED